MPKRLILVTSPPASGKTYISKKLAENLKHIVYLDKDTLIPLSKQIFLVAGEEYNRSSEFFEKYIRDYEYITILDLAFEALNYDSKVLINAPFTREIRDVEYVKNLKQKLKNFGAKLTVIWVITEPEIIHQRMIERNSDRDTWKLQNWEEYVKAIDFSIPSTIDDPDDDLDFITVFRYVWKDNWYQFLEFIPDSQEEARKMLNDQEILIQNRYRLLLEHFLKHQISPEFFQDCSVVLPRRRESYKNENIGLFDKLIGKLRLIKNENNSNFSQYLKNPVNKWEWI